MKQRIAGIGLWLSVLLVLSGTLKAQGIAGDWQGTLVIGKLRLRTILKVSNGSDQKLAADFYSIDQATDPFPVDSISLDGMKVKFSLSVVQGSYDAKSRLELNRWGLDTAWL
jgi:hypothetical protein